MNIPYCSCHQQPIQTAVPSLQTSYLVQSTPVDTTAQPTTPLNDKIIQLEQQFNKYTGFALNSKTGIMIGAGVIIAILIMN